MRERGRWDSRLGSGGMLRVGDELLLEHTGCYKKLNVMR